MYKVIFEHHPKEGKETEFIAAWKKGSDEIQKYPGANGTDLYRSLDDRGTLYAIAEWMSKEARDNAMAAIAKRDDASEILTAHEQFVDSYSTLISAEYIATSKLD
jgi:quinol monooxygenase YgiN